MIAALLACLTLTSSELEVEGTLRVLVIDHDDGTSEQQVFLEQDRASALRLRFAVEGTYGLRTGTRAVVTGEAAPGELRVRDMELLPSPVMASPAGAQTRTLDVVYVGFADAPIDTSPANVEGLADYFFAARSDTVAAYFDEVSFGKLTLVGDAHAVNLSISRPTTGGFDACGAVSSALCAELPRACDAQHVVVIGSFISGGLGLVGGGTSWMASPGTAIHELGHNLGFDHARSYFCSEEVYLPYPDPRCSYMEYGDGYSAMGAGGGHFAAVHKAQAGWLDPANQLLGAAEGLHRISPIELPSSGVQRVYVGGYDLEYRRPIGRDAYVPEGVVVRTQMGLANPHPEAGPYSGVPPLLRVGESFRDLSNPPGLYVKLVAAFEDAAVVQVQAAVPPLTLPAPTVTTSATGAVLSWSTNVAADTRASYGATNALGTDAAALTSLVTAHRIEFTGLAPSTTYHFRIGSRAADGATGYAYGVLTTTAAPPPPPAPPPTPPTPETPVSDPPAGPPTRPEPVAADEAAAGPTGPVQVVQSCSAARGDASLWLLAVFVLARAAARRRSTPAS